MPRIRLLIILGGCLVLSLAGFACGADRSERDGASKAAAGPPPTNLVTNAAIRRTTPRTPERTILTWAQAVQFGDVRSARAAYAPRVRRAYSDARLDGDAERIGALLGRPEIVNKTVLDGLALVRVVLVSYAADHTRHEQPTTFALRQVDGRWLMDDVRLLLDTAAALRRLDG